MWLTLTNARAPLSQNSFILRCKRCGSVLSNPVSIYGAEEGNGGEPTFVDNEHLIESGRAFRSEKPYRWSENGPRNHLDFVPQIWMTIRDLLPAVTLTDDVSRLNGCCGLAGCDGPNRVCACGAEVGTEMSDCWTSLLFIPNPDETVWSST